jgi:hypothetical protein
MGVDARISSTTKNSKENYSYFWNKMFLEFFAFLQSSVDVITEYDETTISIRSKEK